MALRDDLKTPPPRVDPNRSRIDVWIDTLSKDDAAAARDAAKNPAWGHMDLLAAYMAHGCPKMSDTAFGAWRRKSGLPRVPR